ncbi:NAD-dependent DNA ligase LigA [Patescibacteria group bacterium]|nr:NAD-dependent DNA ligase LigA [Patescibacteria group bacterium]
MNKKEIKIRIEKLKKTINHHRYLYHVEDKLEISEAALDSLKKELFDLENENPEFITEDSPTQRVSGKPLDKFKKIKHNNPILSLQDCFNMEDIRDWNDRNERILDKKIEDFYLELKFDGLTIVITYENGILKNAATRGDGKVGEDVTQNIKTIESVPLNIDFKEKLEIRGEAVLTKKEFERINKKREKENLAKYSNPRNTAAGAIRQLDPKIVKERNLDFFAFEIITDLGIKTHKEKHDKLRELGFKTSPLNEEVKGYTKVEKYLKKWEKDRKKLEYETDGAVIIVNNVEDEKKLGHIGKSERWQIAYKFPAEQTTSIVENIIVQVGRTGVLTPVAILKPTEVAGSIISRATLHNQDEIDRLDIRIGDTVIIQKSGDVIPDIVEVLKDLRPKNSKKFFIPDNCPVCGSSVIKKEENVAYFCSNKDCFAKNYRKLHYFVSKKCFNIDGLGPSILNQLLDNGLIKNEVDLFKLKSGDLKPLEKFADKKAEKIIQSILNSKKIVLSKFINSLGISLIGEEASFLISKEISKNIKNNENVINFLIKYLKKENISKINGIGEKMDKEIKDYFNNEDNIIKLKELNKIGIKIIIEKIIENNKLNEQNFLFTGSLEKLEREEAKNLVKKLGGNVITSVSKNLDYLVLGKNPGSKLERAKKHNIKILNEDDFLKLIKYENSTS